MQSNNAAFVIDVASDGTARFRPVSRFERLLAPGAMLLAGLIGIFLVIVS
jgi:hypothetical protein